MRDLWRRAIVGITPYQTGKPLETLAAELGLPELIRLAANENPLGPSPQAVAAIAREAAHVHLYPDGGSTELRDALAQRLGVAADQIVVGNGADELLSLIGWAAFDPGDEVIVPRPSFEPYVTAATLGGAVVVSSPLRGYHTDLDDIRARVTARTKAVFLCSPHNPTATILRRQPLQALLDALGDDPPLVVLDEAYREFCDDPAYPDGVELLAYHPRLIILRTFSKIAGLAGLRVGYAIASADTVDRLNRVRAPYNVNRLGQVAALASLEDESHWTKSRSLVLEERAFLSVELTRRGYLFPPSQANFFLVKVRDAPVVQDRLLRAGLLVRDGSVVGFPGHLRISIGLHEANERLLAVLDALSEGLRPSPDTFAEND
jgi:histidinol-phosphate aminotransferase